MQPPAETPCPVVCPFSSRSMPVLSSPKVYPTKPCPDNTCPALSPGQPLQLGRSILFETIQQAAHYRKLVTQVRGVVGQGCM